jgi:putative acetyltransferase
LSIQIIYPSEKYFKSFHEALSKVASERIYLEMVEAPPFEKVAGFQSELISKNGPVYYAIDGENVVGWCDAFPESNPRLSQPSCYRPIS